jgi:hypothetical protein
MKKFSLIISISGNEMTFYSIREIDFLLPGEVQK